MIAAGMDADRHFSRNGLHTTKGYAVRQAARKLRRKMQLRSLVTAAALAVLFGCATAPQVGPEPVVAPEQESEIPIVKPAPEPPPAAPEIPVEPPSVTVVLTSRSPAYEDVAKALEQHFDSVSVYDLSDKSQPPVSAFRLINDGTTDAVVAIGLRAARSSVALSLAPVVFSQVFNYQDHSLLGERSRGVAAIAPMDAQLAAWKEAEPTLASVGLVIGPGHDDLIEEAEIAAERHGVRLTVKVADSDQEALYYFKRMIRDIDGFWLLPDNRVLSSRALREMVAKANRQSVSVLVPNPKMLSLGATISVSTVAADIAERIRDIVEQINEGQLDAVPQMTALTEIRVETNDRLMNRQTVAGGTPSSTEGKR